MLIHVFQMYFIIIYQPLPGVLLGRLHVHYQPYPDACSLVHCNWPLFIAALHCICSPCKCISFLPQLCSSCQSAHPELWLIISMFVLQVILGTLLAALVPVVGFNAVMTSEHFASFLVPRCLLSFLDYFLHPTEHCPCQLLQMFCILSLGFKFQYS